MVRVMARRGYGRATIAEIAREARVPQGIVHYHFEDKKEILMGVIGRLSRILAERYERRRRRAGRTETRGKLFAWIDAHVALGADADPTAMACWVALGTEALGDAKVRGVYERVLREERKALEELVREALRAERRAEAGARRIATTLQAAVQGAFHLGCAAPATVVPGSMAPLLRRVAEALMDGEPRWR